jgi:hypothetical protein
VYGLWHFCINNHQMKKIFIATLLLGMGCIGSATAQTGSPILSSVKTAQKMKAFVVLVKVPLTYTTALALSVNSKWEKTIAGWKASGHYITSYAFPGEKSSVISDTARVISTEMVSSEGKRQVSNILLRAATLEEAIELAKACPVLDHGGSVEVREIPKGEPVISQ